MTEYCKRLHQWYNGLKRFGFPVDKEKIPSNGIYVLFENGEYAHGVDRVVRVGTHTGNDQLKSRLKQHFVNENKDRSIFRKNIGRCLLNKYNDPFLETWELDLTTRAAKEKYSRMIDFPRQMEIEKFVSKYIRDNFSIVVFQIDNKGKRLEFESKIISTISLCDECAPSENWLGQFSPKERIRESGLWLVNELYKQPLSENDMIELRDILL